eukprot:48018_1
MNRDIVLNILPNLPRHLKIYRCRSPHSADESSDNETPRGTTNLSLDILEPSIGLMPNHRDPKHIASHSDLLYKPPSETDVSMSDTDEHLHHKRARKKPMKIILYNKEILSTLNDFGYHIKDIINAMKFIVNPNDINEIMDRLALAHGQKGSMSHHVHASNARLHQNTVDTMAQRRNFIKHEILSSESTYCECLDKLLNGLISPMFDGGCMDKKHHVRIVSSIPEILEFHEGFLSKLSASHEEHKTMANVFNECIVGHKERFIEIYIEFIQDYKPICELFTGEKNKKLNKFLMGKGLMVQELPSFFILPVQRLPRYILLLTDLRKNTMEDTTEYEEIDEAVEQVKGITEEINERLALSLSQKREMKPEEEMALVKEQEREPLKEESQENECLKKDDNDMKNDSDMTPYVTERFSFYFTFFSFIFIILLYIRFSYFFYHNIF